MNRITGDEVVKAYEATGIEPEPFWYFNDCGRETACGLGVVAIHRGFDKANFDGSQDSPDKAMEFLKLEEQYVVGFIDGFDGNHEIDADDPDDAYHMGLKDGQEASFRAMEYMQTL